MRHYKIFGGDRETTVQCPLKQRGPKTTRNAAALEPAMYGNNIQIWVKLPSIVENRTSMRPQGEYVINGQSHAPTK
jgi:hypothetical protein